MGKQYKDSAYVHVSDLSLTVTKVKFRNKVSYYTKLTFEPSFDTMLTKLNVIIRIETYNYISSCTRVKPRLNLTEVYVNSFKAEYQWARRWFWYFTSALLCPI